MDDTHSVLSVVGGITDVVNEMSGLLSKSYCLPYQYLLMLMCNVCCNDMNLLLLCHSQISKTLDHF